MQDTKKGHAKQVLKTRFYFDYLARYRDTNTQGKFRGCPVNRCFTGLVLDCKLQCRCKQQS